MVVVIGLIVLVVAVVVAIVGVLGNAGPAHPSTESFSVFGYHVTGSTGTVLLFGIIVGAVALLGLSVLIAGARRTADRSREARRRHARSQREIAFVNRDGHTQLDHQQLDGATASSAHSETAQRSTGRIAGRTRYEHR